MRIGVQTLSGKPLTRAAHWDRYVARVLRACRALQGDIHFITYTHDQNHHLYEDCERVNLDEARSGMVGSALDRTLKQDPVDIILSPLGEAIPNRGTRQFVYALDLAHFEPGGAARKHAATLKKARKACAAMQALIVPSEYLRHRCLDLLETPLNRVMVAPPGVDMAFEVPTGTIIEEPYLLLYIDALAAPELSLMASVISQLSKETSLNIAVIGPGCANEPQSWGERAIRIERMPDAHLAGICQHASVFLYPGMYDGCALPIMEALRARAPIVTTKSGAITEFAHTTPFYYNPGNASSLLHAIRRTLAEDERQRNTRTQQGQQAVSDFTWEQCAWRILSAFSKA